MGRKSRKKRERATPPPAPVEPAVVVTPWWRREGLQVAGLLLLALALRVWNLLEARANDPYFYHLSVDPAVYHEWAQQIAGGQFTLDDAFFMGPLYPYFLGGVYSVFGVSIVAARLVQMALGLSIVFLIYLLGRRVFGRRTGLIAGSLAAVYPMFIFYEGLLLLAVLAVSLNLCCAHLLLTARERPRIPMWLLAGVLLGLSALARPDVILLGPVVVVWMLIELRRLQGFAWRRVATHVGGFGIGALLAICPATVHNYIACQDVVLITSAGGANFYIGNRAGATGTWKVPEFIPSGSADHPREMSLVYRRLAEDETGRELTTGQVSRFWANKAREDISADPIRWVRLLTHKLGLILNHREIPGNRDYYSACRYSAPLRLPLPSTGAILPFALLGLLLAIPRFREAFPLFAFVAVYVASMTLMFVLSRYRMPMMPFLLTFAGFAGHRLAGMFATRDLRGLLLSGIVLAPAFLVVNLDLAGPRTGTTYMYHFNLGNTYRQAGRMTDAVREHRRAIAMNPSYIPAKNNLAMILERDPKTQDEAAALWKEVLEFGRERGEQKFIDRATKHLELIRRFGER